MFDVELGWSVTRGQNTSLNLIFHCFQQKATYNGLKANGNVFTHLILFQMSHLLAQQ